MNRFKCDSCGSTKYTTRNNKDICLYCNANLLNKNNLEIKKRPIWLLIIAVLIIIFIIYSLTQNSSENKELFIKNKIQTITPNFTAKNEQVSYVQEVDENYIKNFLASKIDFSKNEIREKSFTSWFSKKEFQALFDTGHYKKTRTYPIYVELDSNGNRRNIEIPYEPRFYFSVKTGRLLQNFQKQHIKYIMNGKKLLSMSIRVEGGVKIYSGIWVSEHVFQREARKLAKYGIYPPSTKFQREKTSLSSSESQTLTELSVSLITANVQDAATKGRISIMINANTNMKFPLDLPQYNDHALGSKDEYHFSINYPIEAIKSVKLSIEGSDAWKMEQFSLKLKEGDKYSSHYLVNANQWLSQETHDINKLGAKPSLTFKLNTKSYTLRNRPTVYLPIID